jgi:hypothetical protein
MNKWLKYFIVAIIWTAILAFLEWIGVTSGHWKYTLEIESLGVWSFLVYYPLVFVAGYAMSAIVDAEITKETHWFHDGLITFSLGSIMAMSMQVSRMLDIFGYQGNWNAVCCWILQTSQIVILQVLMGRIYFSKLWRQKRKYE